MEGLMYKWILGLIAVYVIGDPSLDYLSATGGGADYVVALVSALILMPLVTSAFDG
jgi:hypothetical protein